MELGKKLNRLKTLIKQMESMAIAFSGGVDSSFLLYCAHEILGDNITAVIFSSQVLAQNELESAQDFARNRGVSLQEIPFDIEELDFFQNNPVDRCYFCKKHLFTKLRKLAQEQGFKWVADGSNRDDLYEFRPGNRAIEELNIRSPLREAGLTKEEIRCLSKEMDLPTWGKPAAPCLATRIPYGQPVTLKKLKEIQQAEEYLLTLGFQNVRLRHYDDTARIEIPLQYFNAILNHREELVKKLKSIGFVYITLDLEGFRSGSLNERKNING